MIVGCFPPGKQGGGLENVNRGGIRNLAGDPKIDSKDPLRTRGYMLRRLQQGHVARSSPGLRTQRAKQYPVIMQISKPRYLLMAAKRGQHARSDARSRAAACGCTACRGCPGPTARGHDKIGTGYGLWVEVRALDVQALRVDDVENLPRDLMNACLQRGSAW